jgi:hypothetical protein
MIVRCKINYDVLDNISIISTSITPDKSYRVTEVDDIGFKIINDNGQNLWYAKDKFYSIDEVRDIMINEILNEV